MPSGPPTPSPAARTRPAGFELTLERGRAVVRLADQVFLPGVRLAELLLEVPGLAFPFDVSAGASQFRQHLCDLLRLELAVEAEAARALLGRLPAAAQGLVGLEIAWRAGFAELAGSVEGGPRFTLKLGLEPRGDQALALVAYAPRLYGPCPLPEAVLPFLLVKAAAGLGRGEGAALVAEPLAPALRRLLPSRGWKLPRTRGARLVAAGFDQARLHLAWDARPAQPAPAADPELLSAAEGARAFARAEALLAAGDAAAAREALLAEGTAATHPFGAARLLGLLSADERFHDEALDLAASWTERRPDFAPALAAEARVRLARGEAGRAAESLARLAAAAARRGEELSALAASDACLSAGEGAAPAVLSQAIAVALSVRRDHLPALRALLALGERGDREALLRACRRLAAYAPDEAERARAHATLGRLLLHADPAAARLHLDHALRLAPRDAAAAEALARACEEAGEHLRAIRAWDRCRDLRAAAGDRAGAARVLNALAIGAEAQGRPEQARRLYERSLAVFRQVGDRAM
ncbi:MAG TPA: tetratricopeptide repeat protein, partial [Anaeromyxobacteraceae bacterium]